MTSCASSQKTKEPDLVYADRTELRTAQETLSKFRFMFNSENTKPANRMEGAYIMAQGLISRKLVTTYWQDNSWRRVFSREADIFAVAIVAAYKNDKFMYQTALKGGEYLDKCYKIMREASGLAWGEVQTWSRCYINHNNQAQYCLKESKNIESKVTDGSKVFGLSTGFCKP